MPNFLVCLLCSGQGDFLWLMTKLVSHVFIVNILTLLSLSKHYMLLFILWIRDYHRFSRYINLTNFGFLFLRISFVFSCFCAFIFNMFVTNLCFFSCSWRISLFFTARWSSVLFLCYGLNWLDWFVALKLIWLFVKSISYHQQVRIDPPWTTTFTDDIVICSESSEQWEENPERQR